MFCFPENIEHSMMNLFARLQAAPFTGAPDFDDFVPGAADFLAELNAIHPFRDGNGRTQLAFLHLLALRAGHPLDLSRVKPGRMLAAMVESFSKGLSPLIAEISDLRA